MSSAAEAYGIPPERVVGSGFGTDFVDGEVVYTSTLESFDDGSAEAAAHLGANGAASGDRVRQLQRRPGDAVLRRRGGQAGPAPGRVD
jgi:hypothetical protein